MYLGNEDLHFVLKMQEKTMRLIRGPIQVNKACLGLVFEKPLWSCSVEDTAFINDMEKYVLSRI